MSGDTASKNEPTILVVELLDENLDDGSIVNLHT